MPSHSVGANRSPGGALPSRMSIPVNPNSKQAQNSPSLDQFQIQPRKAKSEAGFRNPSSVNPNSKQAQNSPSLDQFQIQPSKAKSEVGFRKPIQNSPSLGQFQIQPRKAKSEAGFRNPSSGTSKNNSRSKVINTGPSMTGSNMIGGKNNSSLNANTETGISKSNMGRKNTKNPHWDDFLGLENDQSSAKSNIEPSSSNSNKGKGKADNFHSDDLIGLEPYQSRPNSTTAPIASNSTIEDLQASLKKFKKNPAYSAHTTAKTMLDRVTYPILPSNEDTQLESVPFAPGAESENEDEDNMSTTSVPDLKIYGPSRLKPEHHQIYAEHKVPDLLDHWFRTESDDTMKRMEKANQAITLLNSQKNFTSDLGLIPLFTYAGFVKDTKPIIKALKADDRNEIAWRNWILIKHNLKTLTDQRQLPETWVFPRDYLESKAGIQDLTMGNDDEEDEEEANNQDQSQFENEDEGNNQYKPQFDQYQTQFEDEEEGNDQYQPQFEDEEEEEEAEEDETGYGDYDSDEIESDLDDSLEGMQKALQRRYKIPGCGKVIGYKRCGPLYYQCLVKYGNDDAPTYRLVPGGSAGAWDPGDKYMINLAAEQRGAVHDNQNKTFWKYESKDIKRIAGVAWKPHEDDEEDHLNSLDPHNWDSRPPGTYVLIQWKDDEFSWESRTSFRRIYGKANGGPDLAIHYRAKVQEKLYNKSQDTTRQGQQNLKTNTRINQRRSVAPSRVSRAASIASQSERHPLYERQTASSTRSRGSKTRVQPGSISDLPYIQDLGLSDDEIEHLTAQLYANLLKNSGQARSKGNWYGEPKQTVMDLNPKTKPMGWKPKGGKSVSGYSNKSRKTVEFDLDSLYD